MKINWRGIKEICPAPEYTNKGKISMRIRGFVGYLLVIGLSIMVLAGCGQTPSLPNTGGSNNNNPVATLEPTSAALAPMVSAAVQAYVSQHLGVNLSQVQVVSITPVQWPDSCLGDHRPGVACSDIVTPGWLIMASINGTIYEIHTNRDASNIVLFAGTGTTTP